MKKRKKKEIKMFGPSEAWPLMCEDPWPRKQRVKKNIFFLFNVWDHTTNV